MPLYDFRCEECDERFEARAGVDEPAPACPHCGRSRTARVLSGFSGPFTVGMRGYTARRSNATRADREEQRRERREQRREQKEKDS